MCQWDVGRSREITGTWAATAAATLRLRRETKQSYVSREYKQWPGTPQPLRERVTTTRGMALPLATGQDNACPSRSSVWATWVTLCGHGTAWSTGRAATAWKAVRRPTCVCSKHGMSSRQRYWGAGYFSVSSGRRPGDARLMTNRHRKRV
jgi:hypothetical protein